MAGVARQRRTPSTGGTLGCGSGAHVVRSLPLPAALPICSLHGLASVDIALDCAAWNDGVAIVSLSSLLSDSPRSQRSFGGSVRARRAFLRRGRGPWRGAIVGASLALLATSRVQLQDLSASCRGRTLRGEAAERRARTLSFASPQPAQAESRSAARSRTSDRPRRDERRH